MSSTGQPDGPAVAMLRRLASARPAPPDYQRCEMCGERIPDEHSHVVNLASRSLMCCCRPCTLLFAYDEAQLRYRAVPDDYQRLPDLPTAVWDELQIPVGLVFLFRNSSTNGTVACYPGPAGATESELPLEAWDAVIASRADMAQLRPDVEALLLRAPGGGRDGLECYLVPIDRCYELVGRLRRVWRGFDGGQQARAELEDFFAEIAARSQRDGVVRSQWDGAAQSQRDGAARSQRDGGQP